MTSADLVQNAVCVRKAELINVINLAFDTILIVLSIFLLIYEHLEKCCMRY